MPITIAQVQERVARYFDVPVQHLKSSRRHGRLVRARHIAVYLCTELTGKSLPVIGRAFGDRDHTTMINSRRRALEMMAADISLEMDVGWMRADLIKRHGKQGESPMGYMTDGLTFNTLRQGNLHRLPEFRNAKGELSHAGHGNGLGAWSHSDWMMAMVGEVGEAANLIKKVRRGDFEMGEKRMDIARELADVAIYLDLLSASLGIDLGAAVMMKFNEKSDQVGSKVKIASDGWHIDTSVDAPTGDSESRDTSPLSATAAADQAARDIATLAEFDRSSADPAILPDDVAGRLERAGLINVRHDPDDGNIVTLTDKGRSAIWRTSPP